MNRLFAGKVVRKDLVRKVKVGANVPVFVLEFLLGKYCASSDEIAIQMGLQVVTTRSRTTTSAGRVGESSEQGEGEREIHLHRRGESAPRRLLLLGGRGHFGHKFLHFPTNYVRDYERLLRGGVWAQLDMCFEYDEEGKGKYPFWINKLTPIQIDREDAERSL